MASKLPTSVWLLINSFNELEPGVLLTEARLNSILGEVEKAFDGVLGFVALGNAEDAVDLELRTEPRRLQVSVKSENDLIFTQMYMFTADGCRAALVDAKTAAADHARRVKCGCDVRVWTASGMPKCMGCIMNEAVEHSKNEELIPGLPATHTRLHVIMAAVMTAYETNPEPMAFGRGQEGAEGDVDHGYVRIGVKDVGGVWRLQLTVYMHASHVVLLRELYPWTPEGMMSAIIDARGIKNRVPVNCPTCPGVYMPRARGMPRCLRCMLNPFLQP